MVDDRFKHCAGASTCRRGKRGQLNEAFGRSKGGFSTKIHVTVDRKGRPLRFILTGGQAADCKQALALLDGLCADALIADKGYDADSIVEQVEKMGAAVVIPPKANRKVQRFYDKELYKQRNLVERMFNKIKHFRRVATRYDKRASSFLSFLYLASSCCLWLK